MKITSWGRAGSICSAEERTTAIGAHTSPTNRTARETYLWQKIAENFIATYETELTWVRALRQGLEDYG